MILRLWTGYIVSVVCAVAALALLLETAAFLGYFPRGRLTETLYIFVYASVGLLLTALPFFLVTCLIGERLRLRNWWYYAGCGALTAIVLAFWYERSSPWDETPDQFITAPNLPWLFTSAMSGTLGGLAYWFVSGRGTGSPNRPCLPASN
jgi:hypothetical protein